MRAIGGRSEAAFSLVGRGVGVRLAWPLYIYVNAEGCQIVIYGESVMKQSSKSLVVDFLGP